MHRSNRPEFARWLRRDPPAPERVLWARLRNRELAGWKFRRQVPLASFVVDFACVDASLVIEIDGETHVGRESHHAARSAVLEALGWQVTDLRMPT
jgi:very-short-patch-repair endonuclease